MKLFAVTVGNVTGSAVWGQITGNIQDQTDLQAEFEDFLYLPGRGGQTIYDYITIAQSQPDITSLTLNTFISSASIQSQGILSDVGMTSAIGASLANAYRANFSPSGGGTIESALGYRVTISGTSGAIKNLKGFSVPDNSGVNSTNYAFHTDYTSATNKYAIYSSGTAKSYHKGPLHLGSTFSVVDYPFNIDAAPVLSGTAYLTANFIATHTPVATFSDSVTGFFAQTTLNLSGFGASGTIAGAFGNVRVTGAGTVGIAAGMRATVANINTALVSEAQCYRASIAGNVSGGTLTQLSGFYCPDQTAGVRNVAFNGNISSGSNKYNLYMPGTAQNYLAGELAVDSKVTMGATNNIVHQINGAVGASTANVGTLTNLPTAGNPAVFLKLNINGTDFVFPGWTSP